jgi:DNA polymerase-4
MAERHRADRSAELDPAILLVDMDSFFASVEVRDDPSLRGKPVLVGGDGGRGVVASCTYEARRFGIRSAMPMSTAKRLCPDAVVLGGRMDRYAQVSRQLREILLDHSPLVEPLGLDEAFVDVTGAVHLLGTPLEIARSIESRVREDLRLRCGIGVGPSKLIAKLASRDAKPSIIDGRVIEGPGVFVVLRDEVQDYLDQFPVRALYGVGPATAKTLARLGIERVSELARLDPDVLTNHVGHHYAHTLIGLARGEDPRPVVANLASKSIGNEETFSSDVTDRALLEQRLRNQAVAVSSALRGAQRRGRTVTVKVKYADFKLVTRSHTMVSGIDDHVAILAVGKALLATLSVEQGVRLLGISASNLEDASTPVQLQLTMDDGAPEDLKVQAERIQLDRASLDDAVDEIRSRFGRHALGSASMLDRGEITVPTQRMAPFGPKGRGDEVDLG